MTKQDVLVGLHGSLVVERRVSSQHFVNEDSQRPPVNTFVVGLCGDDLGSNVVRSTTKRPGDIRDLFGETEIRNFDVAIFVQQDIFRLQITIDDVMGVEILPGQSDFGRVELGNWVGKSLGLAQQRKELASFNVVHDHEQIARVLEGSPHANKKRVFNQL